METEGENWCEISSGWDLKLKTSTAICRHTAAADRTTVELRKLVFKNTTKKFNPDASLRANKTVNDKIFLSVSISVTRSEFNSELCFHDEVLRRTRGVKLLSSDGPAAVETPDTMWTWWFVFESPVTVCFWGKSLKSWHKTLEEKSQMNSEEKDRFWETLRSQKSERKFEEF